jgi:hypothetical protein
VVAILVFVGLIGRIGSEESNIELMQMLKLFGLSVKGRILYNYVLETVLSLLLLSVSAAVASCFICVKTSFVLIVVTYILYQQAWFAFSSMMSYSSPLWLKIIVGFLFFA